MNPQLTFDFSGKTYQKTLDHDRLKGQWLKIFSVMADGHWRTLYELRAMTGYPEQSISARLRDFRKAKFGGHTVNRRRVGETGVFEYQLEVRPHTG